MSDTVIDYREPLGLVWPDKADLFGVQVSCVDYDAAVSCIIDAAKHNRPGVVSCHSAHAIVTASCDKTLRSQVNQFSMITPDGQPVRWALNALHGTKLPDRVYGPELMLRICKAAAREGVPIYLYGGMPDVVARLQDNLVSKMDGLIIAGSESPPFRDLTDEEHEEVCRRINQSGAKIVMIGLGCPKQDRFAAHNCHRIQGVQMCVGAAFDFHAGAKPTAPQWMQRRGMEWLFRLWCEPRRLWRRYLVTNTVFLGKFTLAMVKRSLFGR